MKKPDVDWRVRLDVVPVVAVAVGANVVLSRIESTLLCVADNPTKLEEGNPVLDDIISFGEAFVVCKDVPSSCFEVEISVMPRDEADERLGLDIKLKSAVDIVLLSKTESKLLCVVDDLAKLEEDDTDDRVFLVVRVTWGDDIISDGEVFVVREDGPCLGFEVEAANMDTKSG